MFVVNCERLHYPSESISLMRSVEIGKGEEGIQIAPDKSRADFSMTPCSFLDGLFIFESGDSGATIIIVASH